MCVCFTCVVWAACLSESTKKSVCFIYNKMSAAPAAAAAASAAAARLMPAVR